MGRREPSIDDLILESVHSLEQGDDLSSVATRLMGELTTRHDLRGQVSLLLTCKDALDSMDEEPFLSQLKHWQTTGSLTAADAGGEGGPPDGLPTAADERYIEGEVLGRGGMGEVRSALDTRLKRTVAIKTLAAAPNNRTMRRFLQEAQITGQLEHPNIIPVHDLDQDGQGRVLFSMKQIHGRSLGELLHEGDAGSLAERLDIFRKACDAMAFAHHQGVIHRDLKPDNIMVGEFGEVLVLDWGLAKVLDRSSEPERSTAQDFESTVTGSQVGLTRDDTVMGTPGFMSPEQAEGRTADVGRPSDIYALGAVLYTLLTEIPPFSGHHVQALYAVMNGDFVPPGKRAPGKVPRELDAIVMRAMALAPGDRYESVEALQADVRAYMEGRPVSVVQYSPWQRTVKWLRRHRRVARAVAATTAVALALLLTSGAWYLINVTQARDRAVEAERDAEVRRADAEVALAAAFAENGRVEQARERLTAAEEIYHRLEVSSLPADVTSSYLDYRFNRPLVELRFDVAPHVPRNMWLEEGILTFFEGEEIWFRRFPSMEELARHQMDEEVEGIAFVIQNDGQLLAGVRYETRTATVDLISGEERYSFTHSKHWSHTVIPARSGQALAVLLENGELTVHSIADGEPLGVPFNTQGHLWSVSDGCRRVLTMNRQRTGIAAKEIVVWNGLTGERVATFEGTDAAALDPAGRYLAHDTSTGLVLTDLETGTDLWTHDRISLAFLRFSGDGSSLVGWDPSGTVRRWDPVSGEETGSIVTSDAPCWVAERGEFVITRDPADFRSMGIRTFVDGIEGRSQIHHPRGVTTQALSPDEALLLTGSWDGIIRLWEPVTGRLLREFPSTPEGTRDIEFSPDGARALSADRDGKARLWDLESGEIIATLDADEGLATGLSFLADEKRAVVGYGTGATILWDLEEGRQIRRYESEVTMIWDVHVSPDGGQVLATGRSQEDPLVTVWDIDSGVIAFAAGREGKYNANVGYAGRYNSDGSAIAVGTHNNTAVVWSGEAIIEADQPPTHSGPVMSVAFSPDDSLLATGTFAGQLQLWERSGLRPLIFFTLHEDQIADLMFRSDGALFSADGAGNIRIFDPSLHQRLDALNPPIVVGQDPIDGQAWHLRLGRVALMLKDWQQAARHLEQAQELGAEVNQLELALALTAVGRHPDALRALARAEYNGEVSPATVAIWRAAQE